MLPQPSFAQAHVWHTDWYALPVIQALLCRKSGAARPQLWSTVQA
jgi:hypothetical protein